VNGCGSDNSLSSDSSYVGSQFLCRSQRAHSSRQSLHCILRHCEITSSSGVVSIDLNISFICLPRLFATPIQGPLKRISASFVHAFQRTTPTPAVVALNLKTGIALAITAAKWGPPDHDNSFRSYLIFHLHSCWGFDLHKKNAAHLTSKLIQRKFLNTRK
jgi:hypothetical protein